MKFKVSFFVQDIIVFNKNFIFEDSKSDCSPIRKGKTDKNEKCKITKYCKFFLNDIFISYEIF